MNASSSLPSLDGYRFAAVRDTVGGEVGPETVFDYHEADGEVWATYAGGAVRRGFLVGTRTGDTVAFRYCQLNEDGETSTGSCVSKIVLDPTGLLRMKETWAWESKPGNGTSEVTEIIVPRLASVVTEPRTRPFHES
ncbi:hypothetical protein [Rathayibacter sp. AY1B8]|uniref:hypothetical protein n=1 Tax=Rathayibacter sp. AY1B8 TaxID=2080533 RepID=UPI000CE8E417|nr:hypothetical protein [Rathayibacter sp. AY1B8]PPI05362.1 hypothetical protein C5C63_14030 [Rathayibacter sp. AY1B8]